MSTSSFAVLCYLRANRTDKNGLAQIYAKVIDTKLGRDMAALKGLF